MKDPLPAGAHAPAGTYRCENCGYEHRTDEPRALPPCPVCGSGRYEPVGDAPAA